MARLVEIVNPNGQRGLVAEGSDADLAYKRVPSTKDVVFDENQVPLVPDELKDAPEKLLNGMLPEDAQQGAEQPEDELPALNASTEAWRAYATSPAGGLSDEDASAMSRDELAEHFTDPS